HLAGFSLPLWLGVIDRPLKAWLYFVYRSAVFLFDFLTEPICFGKQLHVGDARIGIECSPPSIVPTFKEPGLVVLNVIGCDNRGIATNQGLHHCWCRPQRCYDYVEPAGLSNQVALIG